MFFSIKEVQALSDDNVAGIQIIFLVGLRGDCRQNYTLPSNDDIAESQSSILLLAADVPIIRALTPAVAVVFSDDC